MHANIGILHVVPVRNEKEEGQRDGLVERELHEHRVDQQRDQTTEARRAVESTHRDKGEFDLQEEDKY